MVATMSATEMGLLGEMGTLLGEFPFPIESNFKGKSAFPPPK